MPRLLHTSNPHARHLAPFSCSVDVVLRRIAFLALLLPTLGGCSLIGIVEAGPSYAVGKEKQSTGSLNAYLGVGPGDDHGGAGGGVELRGKVGPSVGQVALGPFLYGMGGPQMNPGFVAVPFARAGFNLLQFESVEGNFAFGMFGPHAELGVFLRVFPEAGLSIAVDGEYDVRFTDTANTGYLSLMIGFGGLAYSGGPKFNAPKDPETQKIR